MLSIIGLGLNDENDISLKGLAAVKDADVVYLENYTSLLQCSVEDLEKAFGKKIVLADRALVEGSEEILDKAQEKKVAFLVVGDALSATTHIDLFLEVKKKGIDVAVIHNASIVSAVGITGLQIYKFGRVTSIPFENKEVTAPYDVLVENQKAGLHTLFLLDLKPPLKKFLTIKDGINYLLRVEQKKKNNIFTEKTLCVGCSQLGSLHPEITVGTVKELAALNFEKFPQSLIVPGNLHFKEEEVLDCWRR